MRMSPWSGTNPRPLSHAARRVRQLVVLCLAATVAMLSASNAAAQRAPPGFRVELLYQAPNIEHPSVVACDDQGNLFVGEDPMDMRGPTTEEFDRVLMITFDAEGRPARKTVFCDKLSAVFGLCWLDGALYVMHAPHFTRFRDADGDGVADVREELADGFGPPAGIYGFNDHIVTGIQLGLDGYLYVSVGDKGIQKATGADGSSITLEGGGVVRMLPDGTRLEVVTSGTRNHLDVAMDWLDNIFTYDNTDDGLGWWTRFTHHIPTGYYGYPYDYHPHPERHLPRISEHGGGSPCGAAVYREAAWPAEYRGNAFHCEWGKRKIQRFKLAPRGASFDAEMEDFMTVEEGSEFRPLDLCFSPDGRHMYVADWNFGGWTKPDQVGRLYRVTYVGDDVEPEPPRATHDDPRERQIEALGHPACSERLRAQRHFVAQGAASAPLLRLLAAPGKSRAKVHAIWTLYHLSLPPSDTVYTGPLSDALADDDADVRGQAARAIGELYAIRRDWLDVHARSVWDEALIQTLADSDAGVRMRAAIAIGQSRNDVPPELFAALQEEDVYARFAMIQALRRIGDWQAALEYLDSPDERIRAALLLALTEQYTDAAVSALSAAAQEAREPSVRAAAIAALAEVHLQADPYTTGWWGTQPARAAPARAKKNTWSGTPAVVDAVRQALTQTNPQVRAAAIRAVQSINDADSLASVRRLLADNDEQVAGEALAALAALKDAAAVEGCVRIAVDAGRSETLRASAVDALGAIGDPTAVPQLASLIRDDQTPAMVMTRSLAALAEFKGDDAIAVLADRLTRGAVAVRCQAIEAYAQLAASAGGQTLAGQLDDADTAVREAAIRAVGQVAHRDSVPRLVELAADPHLRFAAVASLTAMPDRRALGVYLDGLTDKNPDVREASRRAVAELRGAIGDDLVELDRRQELTAAARRELQRVFAEPQLIRRWQLAGAWPKPDRPDFDPAAAPILDQPLAGGDRSHAWREVVLGGNRDRVLLHGRLKPSDDAWCAAYAAIESPQAASSELVLGSDDQLVVWLNGRQVYEHRDSRGWGPEQARVPVQLAEGTNHLWVLAGNDSGPWEFSVRVARLDPRFDFLATDDDRPSPEAYRDFATANAGDAERGRKLFEDRQGVGCIKCHAVGGQGAQVGPDLLSVGAKYPRDELIRSVLEPSNRILSGYQVTIVITDDGRTQQGIVKRETPEAIELVDAEGKATTIAISEIAERETTNISMMPNGLKDGMTLEDFADLVAYLESLKEGGMAE